MEKTNLKTLKDLTVFNEYARIYIPTDNNSLLINNVVNNLSARYGGTTSYNTVGTFIMSDKTLVKENITIVEVFTSQLDNKDIDYFINACEAIKMVLKQQSVSLEINKKLYFI